MAINSHRSGLPNTYAYGRSARQLRPDEAVGEVMHQDARFDSTGTGSVKGPDGGMNAALGRAKTTSDYPHPTPEGHVVAPGQRTVDSPDRDLQLPQDYGRNLDQNQFTWGYDR